MTGAPDAIAPGKPHLSVRLAWGAACLSVAVIAVGVGLDRQARDVPSLAAIVPSGFRGYAQESLVEQALVSGKDKAATLAEAKELLRRRPIPAEHLTLLSQAAYATGDAGLSDTALMFSAGRGWRDVLTQKAMVGAAMASGQPDIAVARLTALWDIGVRSDLVTNETAAVISDATARKGFAREVAVNSDWNDAFLTWGMTNLPTQAYAQTVSAAIDAGAQFDCQRLSAVANAMARAGIVEAAKLVWRGSCAGKAGATSADPFVLAPQQWGREQGPFDWDYPQAAGLNVTFREQDGQSVMDYVNTDALTHVAARRYSELAAGTYALSALGELPTGSALVLRVRCVAEGGVQGGVVRLPLSADAASFNIPSEGCPAQLLELVVARGKGTGIRLVRK